MTADLPKIQNSTPRPPPPGTPAVNVSSIVQPSSLPKFLVNKWFVQERMEQCVMQTMVCASFVDRLRLLICTCFEAMLQTRSSTHTQCRVMPEIDCSHLPSG